MPSRTSLRVSYAALGAILALYLTLGALYATHTPAWQAPDEPAHYNYVRHIVATGSLPVLQPGDYDDAYLERLKSERFPAHLSIDSVRYESWQPPLYYLLAAPVFAATGGDLVSLRLFTLLLGSGVVVLTWQLGRAVFPEAPAVALTAAGFVAFIPQHLAMLASANNDALAELWIGLGLWLGALALVALPGRRPVPWWLLGVVLGLGFLTKLSAYPLAALLGLVLLLRGRRECWTPREWAAAGLRLYGPALLLGALWWGRNLAVYGGLDFLAMQRHDAVVQGQLRTAEALAQWGAGTYAWRFAQTTFQSFWGQFGWMGVVMDGRVYQALLAYTGLLAVGLAGAATSWRRAAGRLSAGQADAVRLLGAAVVLAVIVYLYYNLSFVQFQGRYLYAALPVLALAAAVGIQQWVRWLLELTRWREGALAAWAPLALPLGLVALMAALDLFALYRFIVPQLAA